MNTSPDNGIAIRAFANILLNLEVKTFIIFYRQLLYQFLLHRELLLHSYIVIIYNQILANGNKTFCVDQVFSYITNDPYL
jgi:hypothetical protein